MAVAARRISERERIATGFRIRTERHRAEFSPV
jgi:hypothetical protein